MKRVVRMVSVSFLSDDDFNYLYKDFHDILSNSIIESVCDTVDLQSNFILVYAAYMVAMHNIGGTNIGAHFMEKLIQKFDSIVDQRHQASNLLTLICHVYNLGVSFYLNSSLKAFITIVNLLWTHL